MTEEQTPKEDRSEKHKRDFREAQEDFKRIREELEPHLRRLKSGLSSTEENLASESPEPAPE